MVATNPLFQKWSQKRFKATVANDIWPEVLFFSLVATVVTTISELTPHKLGLPTQLLTVLGLVLGLVISFRTSSAYERYQEGGKLWTNVMTVTRNMAQMIWIHVPNEREISGDSTEADAKVKMHTLEIFVEKKTMINLLQAFSVSIKHFLRGEPGVHYEDLYPLICFLPRFVSHASHQDLGMTLPLWAERPGDKPHLPLTASLKAEFDTWHGRSRTPSHEREAFIRGKPLARRSHSRERTLVPDSDEERLEEADASSQSSGRSSRRSRRCTFDPEKALPIIPSDEPLRPARLPPKQTIFDFIPLFRVFRWIYRGITKKGLAEDSMRERRKRLKLDFVESNVPLEICLVLSSYTAYLMRNGGIQPAIATSLTNNITLLQDTLSNLERVRNTPLPFAYQTHLRLSLWLYLLFLPSQLYDAFRWWTIPATAFTSFLMVGFLEIGQEIENPFNYDLNDLDLDGYCLSIQRELHEITAFHNSDISFYIGQASNHPFAPVDRRSAPDILAHAREKTIYSPPGKEFEPLLDNCNCTTDNHAACQSSYNINRMLVSNWKEIDQVTREYKIVPVPASKNVDGDSL